MIFTVTTLADEANAGATESAPGGEGLSLREAVALANLSAGADSIVFAPGLSGVIRLTQGEIDILDVATIDGGGVITISGDRFGNDFTDAAGLTDLSVSAATLGDNSRLFDLSAGASGSTLRGLTLTGGRTEGTGEGGGAVRAAGAVTLIETNVIGNGTGGFFAAGGGIFGGSVTLIDSTLAGNATNGYASGGGGVAGGTITLVNATVAWNATTGLASNGGGVSGDLVRLTNSTITGNAAASTVNGGSTGGGVAFAERLETTDSIILGNRGAANAERSGDELLAALPGAVISASGLTVIGESDAVFAGADPNVIHADPLLVFAETRAVGDGRLGGVLADNGGPVRTVALSLSSLNPALDASGGASATAADARGTAAANQPGIGAEAGAGLRDLGAFEAAAPAQTEEPETPPVVNLPVVTPVVTPPVVTTTVVTPPDVIPPATPPVSLPPVTPPREADEPGAATAGADLMRGAATAERLAGAGGDDTMRGLGGDDTLLGQGGDDRLIGGGGADMLRGGAGADLLNGGGGADVLIGGAGADRIDGKRGDDEMKGGGGADVFVFRPGDGDDVITGFRFGADRIEFTRGVSGFGALTITQSGDDVLIDYGRGSILIEGRNAAAFDESDFVF